MGLEWELMAGLFVMWVERLMDVDDLEKRIESKTILSSLSWIV